MNKCRIGIIGKNNLLTGAILNRLKSWRFPADAIQLYQNETKNYGDDISNIVNTNEIIFICCFCEKKQEIITQAMAANCKVIDMWSQNENSGIVPSINGEQINEHTGYVRIPQIESLQLAQTMAMIQEHFHVESITVSTYQSLAKADFEACQELKEQMKAYLEEEALDSKYMPYRSALNHLPVLFNPLPQVDCFTPNGFTGVEAQLEKDYQALFKTNASVYATCVWVASMRGSSMSIQVKIKEACDRHQVIDILTKGERSLLVDDIDHQMYPIASDVIHDHRCFIGRVRCFDNHTIGLWSVCDEIEMLSANGVMAAFIFVNNDWIRG